MNTRSIIKEVQKLLGLVEDGEAGPKTWAALAKHFNINVEDKGIELSENALNLILKYEVGGGEIYYNKFLKHPTWPQGASGVTIGIGYDLGYNSMGQFSEDWEHLLPAKDFERLAATLGAKGQAAKTLVSKVSDISIPWESALTVFKKKTIPRFIKETLIAFPKADQLRPDAFGALVSLVFNRGSSVEGPTRVEMKNIRALVLQKDYYGISSEIIKMKRLWVGKGMNGLLNRRDEEAKLVFKSQNT